MVEWVETGRKSRKTTQNPAKAIVAKLRVRPILILKNTFYLVFEFSRKIKIRFNLLMIGNIIYLGNNQIYYDLFIEHKSNIL